MTNHLATAWESLKADAIPPNAPPLQIKEMRRAFYAGAQSLMTILIDNVSETEDPDEVTVQDEQLMTDLQAELEQFGEDLQAGRA